MALYSWFTYKTWLFSVVIFVYQRVKTTDWSVATLISFPTTPVKWRPTKWSSFSAQCWGPMFLTDTPSAIVADFHLGRLASHHMDALDGSQTWKKGFKVDSKNSSSQVLWMHLMSFSCFFYIYVFSCSLENNIDVLNDSVVHLPFLQVKRWKNRPQVSSRKARPFVTCEPTSRGSG